MLEKENMIPVLGKLKPESYAKQCSEASIHTGKYIKNFSCEEVFTGKRFQRYLNKTAEHILEFYKQIIGVYMENPVKNIEDWFIELIQISFSREEEEEDDADIRITDLIHPYAFPAPPDLLEDTQQVLDIFLDEPYLKKNGTPSLIDFIQQEFANACREHIARKSIEDMSINESNYFLTIPDTDIDYLLIIQHTLDWTIIDIEHFLKSQFTEAGIALFMNENFQTMEEEKNALEEELKQKSEELFLTQQKLKNEQEWKNEKQKRSQDEHLSNECIELKRQLAAEQKKNQMLQEKQVRLQETNRELEQMLETLSCIEETADEDDFCLDMNGHYIFLVDDSLPVSSRLKEEFPNAVLYKNNTNINASATDMVICLTKSITHTAYNGFKQQCRDKNIPFMHCPKTNLEFIKKAMDLEFKKLKN